jgi:hypothetical protein
LKCALLADSVPTRTRLGTGDSAAMEPAMELQKKLIRRKRRIGFMAEAFKGR